MLQQIVALVKSELNRPRQQIPMVLPDRPLRQIKPNQMKFVTTNADIAANATGMVTVGYCGADGGRSYGGGDIFTGLNPGSMTIPSGTECVAWFIDEIYVITSIC